MAQCVAVCINLLLCYSVSHLSSSASQPTLPNMTPRVLTFASGRVLASVLFSASTYTTPSVLPRASAFWYASTSPGMLISSSASIYRSMSSIVLISTLATVSAQVCTTLLAYSSPSVKVCLGVKLSKSLSWRVD